MASEGLVIIQIAHGDSNYLNRHIQRLVNLVAIDYFLPDLAAQDEMKPMESRGTHFFIPPPGAPPNTV
jgi:hypothetical protein